MLYGDFHNSRLKINYTLKLIKQMQVIELTLNYIPNIQNEYSG